MVLEIFGEKIPAAPISEIDHFSSVFDWEDDKSLYTKARHISFNSIAHKFSTFNDYIVSKKANIGKVLIE